MDEIQKVGFIGLGKMGIPMVNQLLNGGFQVAVYNRNKEKSAALQNVIVAETPLALADLCNIIIVMVADDHATEAVFTEGNGLLKATGGGKIFINMSTVSPVISKKMAALSSADDNFYLDAPVSGSVKQATDGTLVIMVGGSEEPFEKAKRVLDCMGKLVLRVGDHGAGNSAKLAINALLSFHAQGLAEAIAFGEKQGISAENLTELINNSAIGNAFMKIKGEAILTGNFQAAFALKHIVKDLRLAKAEGLNTPLANTALATFESAETEFGEEDIISVFNLFEKE